MGILVFELAFFSTDWFLVLLTLIKGVVWSDTDFAHSPESV